MPPQIYVLHENRDWLPPFADAFDRLGVPWAEWFLDTASFDFSVPPPLGVFYNRMSASSHTRGHRYSAELTAAVLAWLTRWDRRVINGPAALDLEISKARQYAALACAGIDTPRTVVVAGRNHLLEAAQTHFPGHPVILKPNRGGKGLGVRLFRTQDILQAYIESDEYEPPVDGLQLLQEYVVAPRPVITRAEFVGGRFLYAVEVDTSSRVRALPGRYLRGRRCGLPRGHRPASQVSDHRRNSRPSAHAYRKYDRNKRNRHRRSGIHHRDIGPHPGVRCEHQHQLQSGCGSGR